MWLNEQNSGKLKKNTHTNNIKIGEIEQKVDCSKKICKPAELELTYSEFVIITNYGLFLNKYFLKYHQIIPLDFRPF